MQLIKFEDTFETKVSTSVSRKYTLPEKSRWNGNIKSKRQKKRIKIIKEVIIEMCILI